MGVKQSLLLLGPEEGFSEGTNSSWGGRVVILVLVLSSTMVSCYYNYCTDGSTSHGNYG
jgi:hypothetical protein